MTTQTYLEASVLLLAQAETELAGGDVRQASEKGWGAAAQAVKAVAKQRDWPHRSHASLYRTVDRLANETGDGSLSNLFQIANALHQNFYEDWDTPGNVGRAIDAMQSFVTKLASLSDEAIA